MQILVVEVHIKPEMRERFLAAITEDAEHSERDEPGCLRFDVLQDTEDEDTFFYYEVYRDEAALQAHRDSPHFKKYFDQVGGFLSSPTVRHVVRNVHPGDAAWR
ncbi:MAG: antibiotic biosynthesis monooxygenase [Dehalococcoidia bacterium]|nr:antibiotic biosynthesis monooxygenase [Dehalococcoidia bacterium]